MLNPWWRLDSGSTGEGMGREDAKYMTSVVYVRDELSVLEICTRNGI